MTQSTYPGFEEIVSRPNKEKLFTTQRSIKSMIPKILLFGIFVIVAFWINSALVIEDPEGGKILGIFSPRWISFVPFLILLECVREYLNDLYVFGSDTISRYQGRISFKYLVPSVRYVDIRGIIVSQTFWGRVFGYGNVFIGTAAQDQNEVVLEAVDDPYGLSALLEEFREHNLREISAPVKAVLDD